METAASSTAVNVDLLHRLPELLEDYVWTFFRGDIKTWANFVLTCKFRRSKHVNNLLNLKVLWIGIASDSSIRKQVYNTYFLTKIVYF